MPEGPASFVRDHAQAGSLLNELDRPAHRRNRSLRAAHELDYVMQAVKILGSPKDALYFVEKARGHTRHAVVPWRPAARIGQIVSRHQHDLARRWDIVSLPLYAVASALSDRKLRHGLNFCARSSPATMLANYAELRKSGKFFSRAARLGLAQRW